MQTCIDDKEPQPSTSKRSRNEFTQPLAEKEFLQIIKKQSEDQFVVCKMETYVENEESQPSTSKRTKYEFAQPLAERKLLQLIKKESEDQFVACKMETFSEDEESEPTTSKQLTLRVKEESEDEFESDEELFDESYYKVKVVMGSGNSPDHAPISRVPTISNNRLWSANRPDVARIPFSGVPGLKINVDGDQPIDYFNLFLTEEFFHLILKNSNNYAVEILAQSTSEQSRIARWQELTKEDLTTFIGVLLHMGTIKLNRLNDYWKTHCLFNLPAFKNYMSRNRFLLILRALNFSDNSSAEQNNFSKISPVIEFFNHRMAEIYYPEKELLLDESMVLWRGHLSIRQYNEGKDHKYGIKLFVLAEPCGLVQKLLVDGGIADTTDPPILVHKLLEEKKGVGHCVYMDNFYNSVDLSEQLLQEGTYVTGILDANRPGNPEGVISKKLKKGEFVCEYTREGVCVSKWKDLQDVLTISTEFGGEMIEHTTKRGADKTKPRLLLEYNKFTGDIDHNDQIHRYYTCEYKTMLWYKKLGIHIIQIMLLNACYLYNKNSSRKLDLYDFRIAVLEKLLPQAPTVQKQPIVSHLPENCPRDAKGKTKRRRCKYCWESNKTRKDTLFYCPQCPTQPGLCLSPCFRNFHDDLAS